MTPQTLHLEYFGPYRDTTIDFTKFTSTPLFLISGKTGTGKTTIFDGMCYALFDQTSGNDRKPQAMRSDFATFADPTRVTFTFTHRDCRYEIVREPAQTLNKKRGTGVTDVAASVTLTVWDGETEIDQLTKAGKVHDYLENLLQMDGQQFAQIVLLPQGEFRRFLIASSDDKAAVLEQLFHTKIFARWAERLNDQLRHDRQANQAALAELTRVQQALIWDPANQATAADLLSAGKTTELTTLMAEQQAATKAAEAQTTTAYQAAQNRVQALTRQDTKEEQLVADRHQLATLQTTQRELTAQQPAMQVLATTIEDLEWAQHVHPKWTAWQQAQQTQQRREAASQHATDQLTQAQAAHQAAQDARAAADDLPARITQQQNRQAQNARIRPIYEQIDQTQTAQRQAQQQQAQAAAAVTDAQTALQQNARDQAAQQAIIDQQATLYATNQRLTQTAQHLAEWQQQGQALQQAQRTAADQQARVTRLATQVTQAQAAAQAAQQAADDQYQARLRGQIAELSAQLTPGSPCPVCGSTTHPQPATPGTATETVTAAAVRAAQATATQKQQVVNRLEAEVTQLRTTVAEQTRQNDQALGTLRTALTDLAGVTAEATVADLLTIVVREQAQTAQALHDNQRQLAAVATAQQRLATLVAAATDQQTAVTQAQAAAQAAQTALARLTAQLATQRAQLDPDAPTFAAFSAQERQLTAELQRNQAQLTALDQRVTQTQQAAAVAQTNVQNAQAEQIASQRAVQEARTALETALADRQLTVTEDQAQLTDWFAALPTLPAKRQTLQAFQTQQERTAATVAELTKRIGKQPAPDREQTQAALAAERQTVTQLQDQRYAYQNQWQQNRDRLAELTQQLADRQTAAQRTQELAELAGVLNGDGPNSKVGLERYVLQTYLRQILTVGNHRLQQLTNGRYQFVIDETPAASKKRSGLEIDVYDDHVGEQRSVHTLSGGESFIAALALALALGEVIQRTTGSVDVDALFIDEGFGSLDEDALMTALDSLEAVEGQHRMIGIISHVSELRTQVPNQLQVIGDGNGESHVHYQTIADL